MTIPTAGLSQVLCVRNYFGTNKTTLKIIFKYNTKSSFSKLFYQGLPLGNKITGLFFSSFFFCIVISKSSTITICYLHGQKENKITSIYDYNISQYAKRAPNFFRTRICIYPTSTLVLSLYLYLSLCFQ